MSAPWWSAFGPASTRVPCGSGRHQLRWTGGQLVAPAHPDAEAELVLAALGGGTPECVRLIEAWGAHSGDLQVLAAGPRSPADAVPVTWADVAAARSGDGPAGGTFGRISAAPRTARRAGLRRPPGAAAVRAARYSAVTASASHGVIRRHSGARHASWQDEAERDAERRAELLALLALGSAFQFRLAASVAAAWSPRRLRGPAGDKARPALTAALAGRLAPAAAQWLGIDPGQVDATLSDGSGWELALSGTGPQARLTAALPVPWLASVWAPGFAVVGGHLVVQVVRASWPTAVVLALRAPGAEPAELTISDDGHGWSVADPGNGSILPQGAGG